MLSKAKLSDLAHDRLKSMILNNAFTPGEHLDEVALCEMLNLSRTPLREAINRLVNEHLLISVPQKGIFVPEMSIQNVAELFKARKLIEPMVILMSAKHIDKTKLMEFREKTLQLLETKNIEEIHKLDYDFHSYINTNCGNQYILQTVTFISDQFQRVRTQNFYPIERSLNGAREHILIIDKLIVEDYQTLPDLILDHITSTETYYYKNLLDNDISQKSIDFIKKNYQKLHFE